MRVARSAWIIAFVIFSLCVFILDLTGNSLIERLGPRESIFPYIMAAFMIPLSKLIRPRQSAFQTIGFMIGLLSLFLILNAYNLINSSRDLSAPAQVRPLEVAWLFAVPAIWIFGSWWLLLYSRPPGAAE